MSVLNPITATFFGVFAAAYWAVLFLRRLYRRPPYLGLNKTKKMISAFIAAIAFLPSMLSLAS